MASMGSCMRFVFLVGSCMLVGCTAAAQTPPASVRPPTRNVPPHMPSTGALNAATDCPAVDATGATDTTAALQSCVSRAYAENAALFLPAGSRYLVSDTIWVNQTNWGGDGGINIVPCRFRPNVILGGGMVNGSRPTIVLAPRTPGFADPKHRRNVMKITNPAAENINMNNVIRGVDFDVGLGNPGAIALFFHGAQGATVQDVTITLAPDAFAGFGGAGGAGGSHINVKVSGGVHAMFISESEPAPLVAASVFEGQSGAAIVFAGQPPLVLVGVTIRRPPGSIAASAPAIESQEGLALEIIDSVIECGEKGDSSGGVVVGSPARQVHQVLTT